MASTSSTNELNNFLTFLNLEKIDENLFRSKTPLNKNTTKRVYGGQLIGQAMVAASEGIPENLHIHSFHSYFLKGGEHDVPILYIVDKTRDGRTYYTRSVKAVQAGVIIFTMQVSFKQEEPISTVHELTMPKIPHPDELETATEALERFRKNDNLTESQYNQAKEWYHDFPVIIKFVDPEQLLYRKTNYPRRHLWIKAKGHIADDLHQNTHKCCLAYVSDSFIVQTIWLRLAPFQNRSSLFNISLDHCMWFHTQCRADQWLLYELETEHIGDGRALCRGNVWDMSGKLVITIAQEGVMRHKETPSRL